MAGVAGGTESRLLNLAAGYEGESVVRLSRITGVSSSFRKHRCKTGCQHQRWSGVETNRASLPLVENTLLRPICSYFGSIPAGTLSVALEGLA